MASGQVGAWLKARMSARKLSVKRVHQLSGVSRSTIYDAMKEAYPPSVETQAGLARALRVDPDWYDRLLAGLEPVELSSPAALEDEELEQLRFDVMQEITRQAQLLEEVRAGVRADAEVLHAAVLELQHRIEALEQRGRGSV